MKKIITITSHCNTEEKLKSLRDLLDFLTPLGEILHLITHIPLPEDVMSRVDYCFFDRSNPIHNLYEKGIICFKEEIISSGLLKYERTVPDYGWGHINQIKKGIQVAKNILESDYIWFINYDAVVTDDIISKMEEFTRKNVTAFSEYHYICSGCGSQLDVSDQVGESRIICKSCNSTQIVSEISGKFIPSMVLFGMPISDADLFDQSLDRNEYGNSQKLSEDFLSDKLTGFRIESMGVYVNSKNSMEGDPINFINFEGIYVFPGTLTPNILWKKEEWSSVERIELVYSDGSGDEIYTQFPDGYLDLPHSASKITINGTSFDVSSICSRIFR